MGGLLIPPKVFRSRISDFGFEFPSFEACQLKQGQSHHGESANRELAMVVLDGACSVKSSRGEWARIGKRATVFDGLPYTLYLPLQTTYSVAADMDCDFAFCYSRAEEEHPARLVTPDQVGIEIRGGEVSELTACAKLGAVMRKRATRTPLFLTGNGRAYRQ